MKGGHFWGVSEWLRLAAPLVQQGHPEQGAKDHVQAAFEALQGGDPTAFLCNYSCQCSVTLPVKKFFLRFRWCGYVKHFTRQQTWIKMFLYTSRCVHPSLHPCCSDPSSQQNALTMLHYVANCWIDPTFKIIKKKQLSQEKKKLKMFFLLLFLLVLFLNPGMAGMVTPCTGSISCWCWATAEVRLHARFKRLPLTNDLVFLHPTSSGTGQDESQHLPLLP